MNFHKVLKDYLRDFDPELVVLVETKVSGSQAKDVVWRINLPNSHRIEAKGYSSKIWVF